MGSSILCCVYIETAGYSGLNLTNRAGHTSVNDEKELKQLVTVVSFRGNTAAIILPGRRLM